MFFQNPFAFVFLISKFCDPHMFMLKRQFGVLGPSQCFPEESRHSASIIFLNPATFPWLILSN